MGSNKITAMNIAKLFLSDLIILSLKTTYTFNTDGFSGDPIDWLL